MRSRLPLFFLAALVAGAALFVLLRSGAPRAPSGSGRLRVLTTFLPIYVFTANVAGDDADVENLLPAGAGPHEYAFTPGDIRRIADADVIVQNGLGLEGWMSDAVARSGTRATVVDASAGIRSGVFPETVALPGSGGDAGGEEDEAPGTTDPHVWLDPVRAEAMVATIAEALAAADPAHAAGYRSRAEAYRGRLKALDRDIRDALAAVPRKDFIAFHSAFGYFAERYGLVQRAVIEEFPGKEPGAQYVAGLVDLIRQEGVRALFSEPQFSPALVQTIAAETGVRVRVLDTAETGAFASDAYETVMRRNLQTLVEAFRDVGP